MKSTPTKQQIDDLFKDWYYDKRNEVSFIHANNTNTLKWKQEPNSDYSSYFVPKNFHSSYILSSTTKQTAYKLLTMQNIAQKMVNNTTIKNIKVRLAQDVSYTNGNEIYIATNFLDDNNLSLTYQVDLLCGFAIHEAAHINYSPNKKEHKQRIEQINSKYPNDISDIIHKIWNILEDERIEYLTGELRPGLSLFIGKVKKYIFQTQYNTIKTISNQNKDNLLIQIINNLLLAIRFPISLDKTIIENNYDIFYNLKQAVLPFPIEQDEVYDRTEKIIDVIYKLVKQEEKQKQEKQEKQQNNDDSQNSNDHSNNDNEKNTNNKNDEKNTNKIDSNNNSNNNNNLNHQTSNNNVDINQQELTQNDLEQIKDKIDNYIEDLKLKDFDKSVEELNTITEYSPNKQTDLIFNKKIKDILNDRIQLQENTDLDEIKPKNDILNYKTYYKNIKKYIPAIRNILKYKTEENEYSEYGAKSGKINPNSLYKFHLQKENLFKQLSQENVDTLSIAILIDESNSMNCKPYEQAKSTAVLINESIKNIDKLQCFIYGFNDVVIPYKENDNKYPYSLGENLCNYSTQTDKALLFAQKRIRQKTSAPCLMFVITDGEPNFMSETLRAVEKLSKDNFIIIGIGINGMNTSHLFKHNFTIQNINELPQQLGKIMKKEILKLITKKYNN